MSGWRAYPHLLLVNACTPYALEDNRLSPVIDRAGVTQNRRKDVARAPVICADTAPMGARRRPRSEIA